MAVHIEDFKIKTKFLVLGGIGTGSMEEQNERYSICSVY